MAQDIFTTSPEMDLRKRWALLQMQGAGDASPVRHPLQAVARALQGAMGGYMAGQVEAEDRATGEQMFKNLPGIGSGPVASAAPAAPTASPSNFGNAIASIESGGKYDAQGPVTKTGDRAYGKYQVMGANIGPWTKQHLGQEMTPQQFIASPQAQDAVFNGQFGQYAQKYGPEGAARAWFAGEGGMNNPNARDQLGTTVGQYGQRFAQATGLPQVADAGGAIPQSAAPTQYGAQGTQAQQAGTPARTQLNIPPEVAATIQRLGSDPRTRGQAWQLYLQYAKPTEQYVQGTDQNGIPFQRNTTTGKVEADPRREPAIAEVQYARQNWRQLGFPDPSSTDPKNQSFWREYNAKRLGGAGVNVAIDQSAPSEFEKEYGQGMGKRALQVIEHGDAATQDLQQSKLSRAFLDKVKTGKLTPTQATVGAWAKAIGIDPKTLGIDENLPAISQVAQSAIAQQTVGMIGSGGFPANNFSDADRKFLQSIPANIGNLPEANELLADVREKIAQRKVDRADAWAEARSNGTSYEKFEREWRQRVAKEDMFSDVRSKVESMQNGGWQNVDGIPVRKKQ